MHYRAFTPDLVVPSSYGASGTPRKTAGEAQREEEYGTSTAAAEDAAAAAREASREPSAASAESGGGEDAATATTTAPPPKPEGAADLDLIYDPVLNYYFEPKTGKYFELM